MHQVSSVAAAVIMGVGVAAAAVIGLALAHAALAGEARFELQVEEGIGHFSGLPRWRAVLHRG